MKKSYKNTASTGYLNIVIALACEARLLIDELKLKKTQETHPFLIYQNSEKNIHLAVSGVGKLNAACATSYLHSFTGNQRSTCYLNIGICGSKEDSIGCCFSIHKITDATTQQNFYPQPVDFLVLESRPLLSCETPQANYQQSTLVDMESSGFYQAATLAVSKEQIAMLKIVSDNKHESAHTINSLKVKQLAKDNRDNLIKAIEILLELSKQENSIRRNSEYFPQFIQHWHFTTYQQHQLSELLRRWQANDCRNPFLLCQQQKSSKQVLEKLANLLPTCFTLGKE